MSYSHLRQPLRATALLMLGLLLLGIVLYATDAPVFWGGFAAILVFYVLIFFVGAYSATRSQQTQTADEVMVAGRNIPLLISVFTMSATWIDGGYVNGTAEYTASSGLAWVQAPWGYALSLIIGGLFFARTMRRHQFRTMLDPLAQRYGERMAALSFIPALCGETFWTAAILTALGTTFSTVLGLDFNTSIILSALIGITYTSIGGLWAVAFTDVVQLLFLFFGLYLIIPFILPHVGGLEQVWQQYSAQKGDLAWFFPPINGWQHPAWGNSFWLWCDQALLLIFGGIPWQVYFQRVLSAKDEDTAVRLSILSGVVCLFAAVPPIIIGMVGSTVNWQLVAGIDAPTETVLTLPYVIRYLTNPVVATIGLGAVAAAVMSSVDASILSASSMATWNVYRPLIKPDIDTTALSRILKRCVWIIGIAALLMALQVKSVYTLWVLCSDLVYCMLFPQLATALFDTKANRYGAFAGFMVAFILRAGGGEPAIGIPCWLPYPMLNEAGASMFPFRTLAMVSGLLTIIIVSRLTQKQCPPVPLVAVR
jgi:high affinity choline transporter 7